MFLFHKRSKNCRDEIGRWDPGAGQMQFGETPERSVLREVYEEYGVKGRIDKQIPPHSIVRIQNGISTHWLAIPFIVFVNRSNVKINEPLKMDEIDWFFLKDLPKPLHTGFRYSFKKFKTYFTDYL